MLGSSWVMMRARMREVSQPWPNHELLLVELCLSSEEHAMERKKSEDHGGSMIGLKLKVGGVRSDC